MKGAAKPLLSAAIAAIACAAIAAGAPVPGPMEEEVKNAMVTVLYDNDAKAGGARYGWGFAALVRAGETTVLFDTGPDGRALLHNMRLLDANPGEVDAVFLSHAHWDHTGGLAAFLGANSDVDVHILSCFPDQMRARIRRAGARVVEHGPLLEAGAAPERMLIAPGLYTTGEMAGNPPEQSLVIRASGSLSAITGCSHQGIVNLLDAVRGGFEGGIDLVLGGFHQFRSGRAELEEVVGAFRRLGVARPAATHCSGAALKGLFKREMGDRFVDAGVGTVVSIGE